MKVQIGLVVHVQGIACSKFVIQSESLLTYKVKFPQINTTGWGLNSLFLVIVACSQTLKGPFLSPKLIKWACPANNNTKSMSAYHIRFPTVHGHEFINCIQFTGCMENSVDPDQLASDEASWSGSTMFSNKDILTRFCRTMMNIQCDWSFSYIAKFFLHQISYTIIHNQYVNL